MEFDCSTKKVHTLMRSKHYRNGTQQIKGQTGIWEDIGSEPFLEALYHIVCPFCSSYSNRGSWAD
jgi:hypothetical protein